MNDRSNPEEQTNSQQKSGLLDFIGEKTESALDAGKAVVDKAVDVGEATAKQTYRLIGKATQGTGEAVNYVGNLPLIKQVVGVLRLDWLAGASSGVDVTKAEAEVKQIQQQYPNETPSEIAHHIMVKKAIQAGGVGVASSILPGVAAALLAIDLVATNAIQTEMVYEIAAAYGMDLQAPARKGEVLAIFGLALGGSNAMKAGLGFLRNVPLAGAMIGASTNATMLYSLGYAAREFYEAKLREDTDEPATETLQAIQQQSEKYLDEAIAQQAVMDQIMVHMILASYPNKNWEDILPELKELQLNAHSLNTIATNIKSPEPLDALLEQINPDFAVPLLAQCRRIAESSGEVSEVEQRVLDAIARRNSRSQKIDALDA
ncbi:hypothetical protein IQ270_13550 [Microcoleus sp. LEGE 07076]|uniref:hypothetical protein n=1 Tax=Microcoleus sp. LEGE 07076 TaxID=915322 RepID=UPI0018828766|nr:hypothetical protein [Microcoleus sp. LEGE 07076]MBE9185694.1 hypothetical protein [Microcoleus sp. LEGE 07076]